MTFDYTSLRQQLFAHPQTAGHEQFAHDLILSHLQQLHPSSIFTHVGGWGVVAVWGTDPQLPTIAFRSDTDALPIGHRCGHDGHTTILLRLSELVDARPPAGFNVLLLWQPAEETGQGAQAVMESGVLQRYDIQRFYALHNLPGYELGSVVLCRSTFAAASTGIIYHLKGRQTHASTPELGLNPGLAVSEIIQYFNQINSLKAGEPFRQATLICVHLGEAAFGTSAGEAEVMLTLRAFTNSSMEQLLAEAQQAVESIATRYGLGLEQSLQEPFAATENSSSLVETIEAAGRELHLRVLYREEPFRWSEDFGTYLRTFSGAMFGIGSGATHPELHHPDYVFPDSLVEPAAQLFAQLVADFSSRAARCL